MPTLHWIGKEKVINHHHDVPFKVLDHQYGYTPDGKQETPVGSGNMIIHGDNLEALKALLPQYEGKVKCICIDPPYNTGNEGWSYNDNVNDPKITKWLNQVVGKEGEDLSRHDKWLCMMYPRLTLLHRLLARDGVILISIDDYEVTSLKMLLDEIFGINCFFATFVWRRRVSSSMASSWISKDHEYVVAYSKSPADVYVKGEERDLDKYNLTDVNGRAYASMPLTVGMTKEMRPNQWFELKHPKTGTGYWPPTGRVWGFYPPTMEKKVAADLIIFPEDYPNKKLTTPRLKSYPEDAKRDRKPLSTWVFEQNQEIDSLETAFMQTAKNEEGTRLLKQLFNAAVFTYAKPLSLIQSLIGQFTKEDDIILDSFAGSGTTGHAVLNQNNNDNGKRRFILVEMEEYAETITAERVKRVIDGYSDVEGTGGSFDYYELGQPLFDDSGNLNAEVPVGRIREYIWYSETRSAFTPLTVEQQRNPYYLGNKEDTGYYFYYEPQQLTTLDYDFLGTIYLKAEQYVIYADNCLLSKTFLQNNNIIFKKIPRDISRL